MVERIEFAQGDVTKYAEASCIYSSPIWRDTLYHRRFRSSSGGASHVTRDTTLGHSKRLANGEAQRDGSGAS